MQLTLHSIHPEKKTHIQETFAVHKDKSLREATQDAHKVRYAAQGITEVEIGTCTLSY